MAYTSYGIHELVNKPMAFGDADSGAWRTWATDLPIGGALLVAIAANSDTVDHVVQVAVQDENTDAVILADALVPAGAGFDGAPVVDLLAATTPRPAGIILLGTENLWVRVPVVADSGKWVTVYLVRGVF